MGYKAKAITMIRRTLSKAETLQAADSLLFNDGGPGSGNFGHKGRPGQVGGSGKGGGKQYRGGRSDIGYYGSRKDWLNGLSGESQFRAARHMANVKAEYQHKLRIKKGLETFLKRNLMKPTAVVQTQTSWHQSTIGLTVRLALLLTK